MADLDTRLKRTSGIHVASPWRGAFPNPDGAINQADRQTTASMYSGVLATGGGGGGSGVRWFNPPMLGGFGRSMAGGMQG